MTKIQKFVQFILTRQTVTKQDVLAQFQGSEVYRVYYDSFRRNGAVDLDNRVVPNKIQDAWDKLMEENRERKDAHRQRRRFFRSKNAGQNR